jgi:hypothetical protein
LPRRSTRTCANHTNPLHADPFGHLGLPRRSIRTYKHVAPNHTNTLHADLFGRATGHLGFTRRSIRTYKHADLFGHAPPRSCMPIYSDVTGPLDLDTPIYSDMHQPYKSIARRSIRTSRSSTAIYSDVQACRAQTIQIHCAPIYSDVRQVISILHADLFGRTSMPIYSDMRPHDLARRSIRTYKQNDLFAPALSVSETEAKTM